MYVQLSVHVVVNGLESWGGGGEDEARVRHGKMEKDIYYRSARRVLSRRNLEKKDDLERGSAMICAGVSTRLERHAAGGKTRATGTKG